ncbi:MAG: hypothetical protein CSB47_07835 [Proteobacteria bacterium]|nr:MAG: hypothetical protein CSB47_07835 [Pseudomonadota bacterium]
MTILLLGGTLEAKKIARQLHNGGVPVIYSIAGIVRQPNLPCAVISGGFSARGGLAHFIRKRRITGILNATHPFAETMTQTAERTAQQTGILYWRYQRANWQATSEDHWQHFTDWDSLLRSLAPYRSILLTQGQLNEPMLAALRMHRKPYQRFIHRTAVTPTHAQYDWMTWVQGIGPFALQDEVNLLKQHQIEVIVSKHSGGTLPAKLLAARALNIPVMLLERPSSHRSQPTSLNLTPHAHHRLSYNQRPLTKHEHPMPFDYITSPKTIEQESFRQIRELTNLEGLGREQQQVVMRIVHSVGIPEVAEHVRFSTHACENGLTALAANAAILCDVEMVKQGLTKRMITHEPLCFLNDPRTIERAKSHGETRSMAALHYWQDGLAGSVVIIGNAPTALFRLLEMIEQGAPKPALIIGMPVGFVGAAESKQALWDVHEKLGIECITILGRMGGSAVSSASCNALLRCLNGEWY